MGSILLLVGLAVSTAPADPQQDVEILSLTDLESAASVEVGLQAAGLDFWKIEPARAR